MTWSEADTENWNREDSDAWMGEGEHFCEITEAYISEGRLVIWLRNEQGEKGRVRQACYPGISEAQMKWLRKLVTVVDPSITRPSQIEDRCGSWVGMVVEVASEKSTDGKFTNHYINRVLREAPGDAPGDASVGDDDIPF